MIDNISLGEALKIQRGEADYPTCASMRGAAAQIVNAHLEIAHSVQLLADKQRTLDHESLALAAEIENAKKLTDVVPQFIEQNTFAEYLEGIGPR